MKKRNAAIDVALMDKFGTAEDPDAARCLPKRKRVEMTDEFPNVLTADVKTSEGYEYDFRFLMVSADHHKLSIELTNENMELLQAEPMLEWSQGMQLQLLSNRPLHMNMSNGMASGRRCIADIMTLKNGSGVENTFE